MRENFRNSAALAAFVAGFGEVELDCVTGDGPQVRYVAAPAERVVARTSEVARELQRDERIGDEDLAVLWLFHNLNRGGNDRLAEAARAGERVATNSASFKGMERPAVVLGLDMDPRKRDRAETRSAGRSTRRRHGRDRCWWSSATPGPRGRSASTHWRGI